MTASEIQILVCGICLGAVLMNLMHMWWARQDNQRDRAASRATIKRAAGDRFLGNFRLYQVQARRRACHPAQALEAAARDFESDIRDGLDRVERAARDEGLL
ncbi:hypothetical protein ABT298_21390 [Streptomyces sp. NPDC001034]|uniref:hypothetical protein n=1 Tax=Streptomyces sp. NPDC001034 TaxID=3154375 RepID=UPI003331BAE3